MARVVGKQCGFTLIELMVTLVIVAILLTLAAPAFRDMMIKNRLKGAAETLHAELQFARLASIEQNRNISVIFTGSGTTWCYGLDEDTSTACNCSTTPTNCTIDGVQRIVSSTDHSDISLTQNFNFGSVAGVTGFEPVRGVTLDNGTATFTSSNSDTVQVVLANLGRAKICSDDLWDYEDC